MQDYHVSGCTFNSWLGQKKNLVGSDWKPFSIFKRVKARCSSDIAILIELWPNQDQINLS